MASSPCYYAWELKDTIYHLMLAFELLHEAAFGTSDSGCGLGNSLVAPIDRVGSHSFDQIEAYHKSRFSAEKCVLGIVHANPDRDGMDILKTVKNSVYLNPPKTETKSESHGFIGGKMYSVFALLLLVLIVR
ncbi:unnamed protein product [Trichobilharzia regenti]|nr:unnamed protein product [Trichobilharzia regenti]